MTPADEGSAAARLDAQSDPLSPAEVSALHDLDEVLEDHYGVTFLPDVAADFESALEPAVLKALELLAAATARPLVDRLTARFPKSKTVSIPSSDPLLPSYVVTVAPAGVNRIMCNCPRFRRKPYRACKHGLEALRRLLVDPPWEETAAQVFAGFKEGEAHDVVDPGPARDWPCAKSRHPHDGALTVNGQPIAEAGLEKTWAELERQRGAMAKEITERMESSHWDRLPATAALERLQKEMREEHALDGLGLADPEPVAAVIAEDLQREGEDRAHDAAVESETWHDVMVEADGVPVAQAYGTRAEAIADVARMLDIPARRLCATIREPDFQSDPGQWAGHAVGGPVPGEVAG